MSRVPGKDLRVRAGAELGNLRRGAGALNSPIEVGADRASGSVLRGTPGPGSCLRTWWYPCRCTETANESGGITRSGLFPNRWPVQLRLPHKAVSRMRTRPRPDKQILSLAERWESVRGAFATRPGSQVDNKRVLLVDEVMTTGATLDACVGALLESGAKSVLGLTVARAAKNRRPHRSVVT